MIIGSAKGGVTLPNENNSTVGLGAAGNGVFFEDDYTDASLWTQDGSEINVDDDYADHVGGTAITNNASIQRVYREMPNGDLSDTLWYLDMTQNYISGTANAQVFSILVSGGNNEAYGTIDLIGLNLWYSNATDFGISGWCRYTDSGSTQVFTSNVIKTQNTEYYYRVSRDSATQMTVTLFTDEPGGTVAAGFPVSATIPSTMGSSVSGTALNTVQTSNFNSGDVRTQSWKGTDIKIYNDTEP